MTTTLYVRNELLFGWVACIHSGYGGTYICSLPPPPPHLHHRGGGPSVFYIIYVCIYAFARYQSNNIQYITKRQEIFFRQGKIIYMTIDSTPDHWSILDNFPGGVQDIRDLT